MQKEFTKADLKDGMVVEERRGVMGFVLRDRILYEDGWDSLESWCKDLKHLTNNRFDIIKVYKIKIKYVFELSDILNIENLELIWRRTEIKHMITKEMRQKLEELTGEKIEVEPSEKEMIGACYKYCSNSANGDCGKDCVLLGLGDCNFEDYLLCELEHDEFEDDIDPSDYFDDDYCYECQGYGDDYQVDEDGDLICMCDNCVHNPNNWDDGYWIGDDDY